MDIRPRVDRRSRIVLVICIRTVLFIRVSDISFALQTLPVQKTTFLNDHIHLEWTYNVQEERLNYINFKYIFVKRILMLIFSCSVKNVLSH